MQFVYTPYILPLLAAALISGWVALYAWSRRTNSGAIGLTLLATAVAEWSIGYALELAGADLETKVFWGKLQYLGIVLVPLMWVGFTFHHADQAKWLTFRAMGTLSIVPIITFLLVLTTESHGLVWTKIGIISTENFSVLQVSYGAWFWVHTVYSYILLLTGTGIVIRSVGRMKGIYRRQSVALLLAVLAPWIGNAIYLFDLGPVPNLDLTPFAFTITVVAFTWGIFGFQLVDLSPIGRATVVDEMESGMIVLDMANRIVDINPSALRALGMTNNDVLGRKARDIFAAWPDLTERYSRVIQATDEITIGDGESQRWYELQLSPLHDRRDGVVGRVITITDITSRKRAESLLIVSEARYRQIVESAGDIIYRTDSDGRFTYANPIALRLLGYNSESEVVGKHYLELAAPESHTELKRFYGHQFIVRKKNTYYEFSAITADGRKIWLGQNVQIIEDNTRVVGFQAVARDITELRRTQDALALARDQALEASRLKSQLLAKVSHELRTPLGGILGYAELMNINAFGDLTDRQKDAVAQIIDSTNYLTHLVNELLDEAQIESKTIRLFEDRFSPADLLRSIKASVAALVQKKGLEFVTNIDPNIPLTLYGDFQRLEQILVNLVGNSIKFTKKGRIQVSLYAQGDETWVIEVSDTGKGIPEDAMHYIFEPFRQVDPSSTNENQGTGLGLAITKQLVELMKGKIQLRSEVGVGSTFIIELPLQKTTEGIA